jgi:hypothetical protein
LGLLTWSHVMDFSTILENVNLATFGQIMFANIVLLW